MITLSLSILDAQLVARALDAYAANNRTLAPVDAPIPISADDRDAIRLANRIADSIISHVTNEAIQQHAERRARGVTALAERRLRVGLPEGLPVDAN